MTFEKTRDRADFLIFSSTISIYIPKNTYHEANEEDKCLERARRLDSDLYRRKNGVIVRVVEPGKYSAIDVRRTKAQMSPEMLGNDPLVPGIKANY